MGASMNRATFSVANTTATVIAATAGKQIHIHGGVITGSSVAGSVDLQNGGAATVSGVLNVAAAGNITLPFSNTPYLSFPPGSLVSMVAATTTASGFLIYSLGP